MTEREVANALDALLALELEKGRRAAARWASLDLISPMFPKPAPPSTPIAPKLNRAQRRRAQKVKP